MHRRHVTLDGRDFTVLTLRPSSTCRFATNHFHSTWHVMTDVAGARMLGRLCWSLTFQRRAGTIVVIDRPLLVPSPFDTEPSSPIVFANADLAPLNHAAITQLKGFLARKHPSEGSVRLQTHGLDRLLAGGRGDDLWAAQHASGVWWNKHQRRTWTDRVDGIVVASAAPPVLHWWAVSLSQLGSCCFKGSDYMRLEHPTARRDDGEVQIFEDFADMVEGAIARRATERSPG